MLWLLPIVILSGFGTLIYFTQFAGRRDEGEDSLHKSITDVGENNKSIRAYVEFVNRSAGRLKPDRDYNIQAFVKLAMATSAAADFVHVDQSGELKKVKAYTNQLTTDPSEANHAGYIRKSAELISGVLYKIQQTAYPELASEASAVKTAASQIDVNVERIHQTNEVNTFFVRAADLLQKMN